MIRGPVTAIGEKLAKLGAEIAMYQISVNRLFVAENPSSSDLWHLDYWQQILNHESVICAKI